MFSDYSHQKRRSENTLGLLRFNFSIGFVIGKEKRAEQGPVCTAAPVRLGQALHLIVPPALLARADEVIE